MSSAHPHIHSQEEEAEEEEEEAEEEEEEEDVPKIGNINYLHTNPEIIHLNFKINTPVIFFFR